jgi:DNA helicase IV
MTDPLRDLEPEARTIVEEELALFARVRAALGAARPPAQGQEMARSREVLRALRDEAMETRAEDLPGVLHEMTVRQRLIERPREGLPDARAPYLAHLRLREEKGPRDYLLGHVTFLDARTGVRIVDWRVAPVAQIFYRYREGDTFEEVFPGRVAEGQVEARRVIVFQEGEPAQIVSDRYVFNRDRETGRWTAADRRALALAPGGAGTAARPGTLGIGVGAAGQARMTDVTALLDAEQYAAVCAPPEQPLLVLGSAGSGKTTVALHRLARVAALGHPLSQMRVVVPEEGLARLSRRLLAPLGAGAAQVETLDAWATALARQVFGEPIKLSTEAPASVSGLKRHPALYRALYARLGGPGPGKDKDKDRSALEFKRLRRRLAGLLSDRAFLGEVAAAGGLTQGAVEETVRHTMLQLRESADRELAAITDPARRQAIDGLAIAEGTPDELAGTVDVEDLPILLAMRAWRGGGGWGPAIAHLVLDEAEDFSLFDLLVLSRLLGEPRSVTLAGDEAQQTHSSFAGWPAGIAALGVRDAATCRLSVSYRCPRPVAELARRLLGSMAPEGKVAAAREGAPVGILRFPSEAQAQLFLAGALRDLVDREPNASVGIIAKDAEAARRLHRSMAGLEEARLVEEGAFTFEPGIDVTNVDDIKGLEFDYVVVPDATAQAYPESDEARRRLHVAVTRASHQLWILAGGAPSPLLRGEDG